MKISENQSFSQLLDELYESTGIVLDSSTIFPESMYNPLGPTIDDLEKLINN